VTSSFWFEPTEATDVRAADGETFIGRVSPGKQYQALGEDQGWAVVEGPDGVRGHVPLGVVRRVPAPAVPVASPEPSSPPPTPSGSGESFWFEVDEAVEVIGADGTPIGTVGPGRPYRAAGFDGASVLVEGPGGSRGSVPADSVRRVAERTAKGAEPTESNIESGGSGAEQASPTPPPTTAPPEGETPPARRRGILIAALGVVLVVVGVFAALVLTRDDDEAPSFYRVLQRDQIASLFLEVDVDDVAPPDGEFDWDSVGDECDHDLSAEFAGAEGLVWDGSHLTGSIPVQDNDPCGSSPRVLEADFNLADDGSGELEGVITVTENSRTVFTLGVNT
jgi:hypothetical protein